MTVKTLHDREVQILIDDLIDYTTDYGGKLLFKVGDNVICRNRNAVVVSRYKHDRDTPYRIQFDDGRQIQVPEASLSPGGKHDTKAI